MWFKKQTLVIAKSYLKSKLKVLGRNLFLIRTYKYLKRIILIRIINLIKTRRR